MRKFVVTGPSTYGVKNAGDDAMFSNLVSGLRREFPGCDITFVCRHPDAMFDATFGVHSIKNIDHDSKQQSLGRWFYGFNPGDDTTHLRAIKHALEECDALIIGGNSFMEISPNDFLRGISSYSAMFAQWAKFLEKPYFIYGLAVHPAIRGDLTKQVARFVCNNARLVMVREEFTKQCLLDAGVTDSNIHVLADPAFGVDPIADRSKGLRILHTEGIELRRGRTIGVGFRLLYWAWGENEVDQYSSKMAELCDYMVGELDADLLFISNCTYNVDTKYEDDRFAAQCVKERMKHSANAHLIKGDYLLPDILSLFPHLDMHISNRRHSCIFAALHGISFVSMVTEMPMHIKPFMEALGVPTQVISFTDDDLHMLRLTVKNTWQHREKLCSIMASQVAKLRKLAHRYSELIAESLLK